VIREGEAAGFYNKKEMLEVKDAKDNDGFLDVFFSRFCWNGIIPGTHGLSGQRAKPGTDGTGQVSMLQLGQAANGI
jgi:hypothetical protein